MTEPKYTGPLLTRELHERLCSARDAGDDTLDCSMDLGRTSARVVLRPTEWNVSGTSYPYLEACKDRTIYYWAAGSFTPAARYEGSLIKLVPTEWGPPTFEIDGIKMLPTAKVSPYEDARNKVALIRPHGKVVLDTCGGLGYFAAWCLAEKAAQILSFEINPNVIWLRSLNPWSPKAEGALTLTLGDITAEIGRLPTGSVDAALHDPPRFGIAGELYSQQLYGELARVLKRGAGLFHYTGTPNKVARGRDLPNEVATRLRRAGFSTELSGDGVLAVKRSG